MSAAYAVNMPSSWHSIELDAVARPVGHRCHAAFRQFVHNDLPLTLCLFWRFDDSGWYWELRGPSVFKTWKAAAPLAHEPTAKRELFDTCIRAYRERENCTGKD